MNKLEETKKKRFEFLNSLYEITGGSSHKIVNMFELGTELAFDREEVNLITQYLAGEHLMEHRTIGGGIGITHYGVKEVEEALSHPEKPTTYFPPVNIIHIHHMEGSQIQQGTISSSQTATFNQQSTKELLDFIKDLRDKQSDLKLSPDDASELSSDIDTVESQLKSSRPKTGIITEGLKSIKTILEGAAGSWLASDFLSKLPQFLTFP
jgi:hypothetical protein